MDNTKDIIKRVQSGDENAFSELYETYYRTAFMAANQILATNKEEAEDVAQETFLYVYNAIKGGTEINNTGGFIKTCAENKAKDHIKAREAAKRPKEVYGAFDEPEDGEELDITDLSHSEVQKEIEKAVSFYQSPEDALEESEVSEIIRDILNELPDIQQEPLTLFYLNDMKIPEIADIYGVSEATIKSRLFQGRKKVETKVLEYEKKNKIKLHSFAPLPFFFFLLRQKMVAEAASIPALSFASDAAKVSSTTTVADSASAATSTNTITSATSFFAQTVTIGGKTIGMKTIAVIVAAVVGLGGIAKVATHQPKQDVVEGEVETGTDTVEDAEEKSLETFVGDWKSDSNYVHITLNDDGSGSYELELFQGDFTEVDKENHVYEVSSQYIYSTEYSSYVELGSFLETPEAANRGIDASCNMIGVRFALSDNHDGSSLHILWNDGNEITGNGNFQVGSDLSTDMTGTSVINWDYKKALDLSGNGVFYGSWDVREDIWFNFTINRDGTGKIEWGDVSGSLVETDTPGVFMITNEVCGGNSISDTDTLKLVLIDSNTIDAEIVGDAFWGKIRMYRQ